MFNILIKHLTILSLILIILNILLVDALKYKSISDEICHSLWLSNGNQINLLAIGVLNPFLLAITNDYQVFKVNLAENIIQSLQTKTKPRLLADIYPILNSNDDFKIIFDFPINAYLMIENKNKNWIILNTWIENTARYGLAFDMHRKISGQWFFFGNMSVVPISTEKAKHFYLWKQSNQNPNAFELNEYSHLEDQNYNQIKLMRSSGIICETNEQLHLTVNISICNKPVNWRLITGFVARNHFFLFDNVSLYVFEESIMNDQPTVPVKIFKYSNYFQCSIHSFKSNGNFFSGKTKSILIQINFFR